MITRTRSLLVVVVVLAAAGALFAPSSVSTPLTPDRAEACGFEILPSWTGRYWALYECGSYIQTSNVPVTEERPTWIYNSDCDSYFDDCDRIIFITDQTRDQLRVPTPVAYHPGTNREYTGGACVDWRGTPGDPDDPPERTCDIRTELRPLGPPAGYQFGPGQPRLLTGSFYAVQLHQDRWISHPNEFLWAVVGQIHPDEEQSGTVVVRCVYGRNAEERAEAHAAWRNSGNSSSYVGCGASAIGQIASEYGWLIYQ